MREWTIPMNVGAQHRQSKVCLLYLAHDDKTKLIFYLQQSLAGSDSRVDVEQTQPEADNVLASSVIVDTLPFRSYGILR